MGAGPAPAAPKSALNVAQSGAVMAAIHLQRRLHMGMPHIECNSKTRKLQAERCQCVYASTPRLQGVGCYSAEGVCAARLSLACCPEGLCICG